MTHFHTQFNDLSRTLPPIASDQRIGCTCPPWVTLCHQVLHTILHRVLCPCAAGGWTSRHRPQVQIGSFVVPCFRTPPLLSRLCGCLRALPHTASSVRRTLCGTSLESSLEQRLDVVKQNVGRLRDGPHGTAVELFSLSLPVAIAEESCAEIGLKCRHNYTLHGCGN